MSVSPLLIEFIPGTHLRREAEFSTGLPILNNGPPGTFLVFASGREVPLPTDQIVEIYNEDGAARVGFGGMRFDGCESGQLVFLREKDLLPEAQLSPERRGRMTLDGWMVASVSVNGQRVWPPRETIH